MSNLVAVVAVDWTNKSVGVSISATSPGAPIEIRKCNPPCTSNVPAPGLPADAAVYVLAFPSQTTASAWVAANTANFDFIHTLP